MYKRLFSVLVSYTSALKYELFQPGSGPACNGSLIIPAWLVQDFNLRVTPISHQSNKPISTGFVSFMLNNTGLSFRTNCSANNTNWPHYFDGIENYQCDVPDGEPNIDSATFTYSWLTGQLNISQTWICSQDTKLDLIPRWTGFGGVDFAIKCNDTALHLSEKEYVVHNGIHNTTVSCDSLNLTVPIKDMWLVDNGRLPGSTSSTMLATSIGTSTSTSTHI